MQNFIIIEGKDYDNIIKEASEKFQVKKEQLKIEILESKKSFFSTHYKVKASIAESMMSRLEDALDNLEQNITSESTKLAVEKVLELSYESDGVYLRINEQVEPNEVLALIDLKEIKGVNAEQVKSYIKKGSFSEMMKIAESQEEKKVHSICDIKVTKDAMKAYIYIYPPQGGDHVTKALILDALNEKKVIYGIKEEIIDQAVQLRDYDKDILIAEGLSPVNGSDSKLEYKFDISNQKKITINEDGKIDYRELSIIQNVEKGQSLVELIPHTEGIPGKNVLGIILPAKDGKKLTLPKGKNVEVSEEGSNLIASINGRVSLIDGKVHVSAVYEVKSDVDNSVGNIRFVGKVIVKGNVLTGFIIEADDDVEVFGVVEGAKIVSKANIILHRGIQGMNKGELQCEGDLVAKFIENCQVQAKGNIISEAIMHSNVICGKKLEVKGRKGLLVGGQIRVSEEIKTKVIGSPMSTITELEVGTNPDIRKKYDVTKDEIKQISQNLEKASQAVELLTKISRTSELPEDKKLLLSRSIQLKLQLSQQLESKKNEMQELENYLEEINNGKIKVSDIVYPGTRITIGSSKMYVKDAVKYTMIYRSNAEIKTGPYED